MRLFARWSKGLGFLSQQQAMLQQDCECRPMPKGSWLTSAGLRAPPGLREPGRTGVGALPRVTRSLPKARPAGPAPSPARLWAERGGHSVSWVPRQPGEAPTLTALLALPVTCARKVFQVSCLPEHRTGSYTPGLCCREGPGTGVGADTPRGDSGVPQCSSWFSVNASTSRGDGARRVLRGWPGAGLLAQPPGSLVWGGLLFQIKRFHKALEMRLTCLPSTGRNGRWGAALLGLPSVQGEEDGCGGAHPELDHPAHKQLRVGARGHRSWL